ncbi:hypothetical protein ACP70R_029966 [Stipagrostis hirtigluma subsp. patula]
MGFVGWPNRVRAEAAPPVRPRRSDPPSGEEQRELTAADALQFVDAVKRELIGERGKYDEFLAVLIEFRRGSIGTAAVADRVSALLDGHPNLMADFNAFLPAGHEIQVPEQGGGGGPRRAH